MVNLKSNSLLDGESVIEILLRTAQSLYNNLKTQLNLKAATNVSPYAKQYNALRSKTISLFGEKSLIFLPELSKKHIDYQFRINNISLNVEMFDEILVAVSQLVSFLETQVKYPFRMLTELEEYLNNNLRKNVREKPILEKDIQDIIEIMLNSKGYVFKREKSRIGYSNKEYIPDFTFEDLNAVLEIKLCKSNQKEKDIIDEINADIPAYMTEYNNITFLVYDLGIIRDIISFIEDIERNTPRIKILIIKH